MPIITVQRRMAEQGRIRLGQKVTGTSKAGKTYTRPGKLDRFRFTSPNQRLIDEVAAKYGGTAQPWDNDGKAEHEVVSDARAIPVIVVKGGFSQWHEYWTKGGCQHRCDGEKDAAGTFCDPQDPAHLAAIEKPTTRLSVMLSEIETLGVWRMESKGWNAAAELPSMAELAMHVGDLVPATLSLAERSSIVQVNGRPQTSRFVVPVLDLHVTKARLVEIAGGVGSAPEITGGPATTAPAIEAARPDYAAELEQCTTVQCCQELWHKAGKAGHLDDDLKAAISARVSVLTPTQDQAPADEQPPHDDELTEEEPVEGEVVDEDREQVWHQVVTAAGKVGIGSAELAGEVEANTGKSPAEASADDLRVVLELLTTGVAS